MKILNIQGGKKPVALVELVFLRNKYKLDIMFILEIMTSHQNSQRILKALHFDNKLIIDCIDHCGCIWIVWNNNKIDISSH